MNHSHLKVAIIDLYNNEPNQGMRCIQDIVLATSLSLSGVSLEFKVYDTRYKNQIPDCTYDIYISTGGPGSPYDGEGTLWEKQYFSLLESIWNVNQKLTTTKKYIFFICHSFQMACRFFDFGEIKKRNHRSFGIHPVYRTEFALQDRLFGALPDPFYAADFREYEVIRPRHRQLEAVGANILAIEQARIDKTQERAMMAIRISDELIATQFHPEADPQSMLFHFNQPERKLQVVEEFGNKKYDAMIDHLREPDNILKTRENVLPEFLRIAAARLRPELLRVSA